MGSLLNDVNILITKRVGDLSRLDHIKETIENNKQLYDSDRKYLDELIDRHLFSKETPDTPKAQPTTLKDDSSQEHPKKEEPKDTSVEINKEITSEGSFCGNCGKSLKQGTNFCPCILNLLQSRWGYLTRTKGVCTAFLELGSRGWWREQDPLLGPLTQ